ncbi:hypothetical protein Q7P37_008185 [Cladosporium fusiforme]
MRQPRDDATDSMARISGSSSAIASKETSATAQPASSDVNNTTATATRRHPSGLGKDAPSNDQGDHDYSDVQSPFTSKLLPYDPSLFPSGKRSISSIGQQAFWLGFALATSLILGLQTAYHGNPVWRVFAFISSLSLFHFLEFWTTATYNTPEVRATSFLLFTNGRSYNIAHSCALLEVLVSNFFYPAYQAKYVNAFTVGLGIFLVVFGQATRSLAMATAGTNFNHIPQKAKKADHELVTSGVYAYSRHPSYFAFFWWAIGTQLLVGNKVCLLAFVGVLWHFFNDRIKSEERSLVEFFGEDYDAYRKSTRTGIPFI